MIRLSFDAIRRGTSSCMVVAALGLAGCGSKATVEKVIVSGEVTFKGQPVANGEVLFYPMPGTKGPMSGASIKDGHYVVTAKGGVPVGEHLVRISGYRSGSTPANDDMMAGPKAGGERVQFLPAKYNEQSELRFKTDGSSSEVTQNFNLDG